MRSGAPIDAPIDGAALAPCVGPKEITVITTILNSIPGRVLRFAAGSALSLWGFAFAVPEGLFVQTLGVAIAVFALVPARRQPAVGNWQVEEQAAGSRQPAA